MNINCNGELISLETPKIMGILNVTDDSFFDGGKYTDENSILERVEIMVQEEVDIIDIGGQSTRPGAKIISTKEELNRVIPAIKLIKKYFPNIILSIDTFWSEVAYQSVNEGVSIINDVSAGIIDHKIFEVVQNLHVPYILTHNKEIFEPNNKNYYDNIATEINTFFFKKIKLLYSFGIKDVILDPGFGFAKTLDDNYNLLKNIDLLGFKSFPLIIGISRKSMIYKLLDSTSENSLNETTALHLYSLTKGISILRVHDIKVAKNCVKIFNKLK